MINIVIPMAGRGSRFSEAGYKIPKPLIPINNKPMIQVVTENLTPHDDHKFIYIVLEEHLEEYNLGELLSSLSNNTEIVVINEVTEGAACTVLMAEKLIDNSDHLMIANSDQWINYNINEYLKRSSLFDGYIMTMFANDPKWSFIETDQNGLVQNVVEKEVVSNEATVGIYNFTVGSRFVSAAKEMIDQKLTVNGEYYVAPVYNQLISLGSKIGFHNIDTSVESGMYGLGTPSDLDYFLNSKHFQNI